MIFTYDKASNAAYLQIAEVEDDRGAAVETVPVTDDIIIDYDSKGQVFGIEFLNASDLLPASLMAQGASKRKKTA
jgi:uncharacterized protein YuzE